MECRLKIILWEMNKSQRWLAERIEMTETNLSKIARGKQVPKLKVAIQIAKEVKKPVEEIWIFE